jgi:MFS family permease
VAGVTDDQLRTASPAGRGGALGWAPLAVLMTGTFVIVLDFFAVNVALPSIQAQLGASAGQLEWVVAAYGLTFAVFLVAAGRVGDRIGRRRTLALGLSLFVVASAVCGAAIGPATLIAARLAQGAGAAMISPNVLSLLGVIYPGPRRVRAITVYGIVMGVAAAGGQALGGLVIAATPAGAGWRAIFLLNVPVGLLGLALLRRLVPESRSELARRVDLPGMALATAGLAALALPLIEGHDAGWPAWTWASFGVAAALLATLAVSQRHQATRRDDGLLAPLLLAGPGLRFGLAASLAFWCTQAPYFLILALYLQDGRGLSPLQAALVFTVLAVAYLAASLKAPALTARFGHRLVLAGVVAIVAGDALLYLVVQRYGGGGPIALLIPGLALAGAGQGLAITPLTSIVMAHANPEQAGAISGALSTTQQVGNTLGVAVTGAVFYAAIQQGYPTAFGHGLVQLALLLLGVAALVGLGTRGSRVRA